MPDLRRFDVLEKVVRDNGRLIDDAVATILSRMRTQRGVPVVTATSQIVAPFTGQLIVNTTDQMIHEYDGTQRHAARYEQTTLQTVANLTDSKVQFNTPVTTCDDVTPSGTGNQDFLLNRGGEWRLTASERFVAGTTGERHMFLSTGTVIATLANRIAGTTAPTAGTIAASLSVSTEIRVTAGTSVFVGLFQSNGGNLNTDVAFGHSNHFSLTWLRP
jgi:hypothetical protein